MKTPLLVVLAVAISSVSFAGQKTPKPTKVKPGVTVIKQHKVKVVKIGSNGKKKH